MPFDYDDPYVEIACKIRGLSAKAVKIEDDVGREIWIPRSCVHGGDDGVLRNGVGDDFQLKVRRWFAAKEGLI